MEKTIRIGDKDVKLSNNVSWAMAYRDQFGHDIISTLTPLLASFLDVVTGIFGSGESVEISAETLLTRLNGDTLLEAMAHFAGFEFVDVINITWAMAKAADPDLPEPRMWVREFEEFPVDVIVPEVAKLVFAGLVSRKNLIRLRTLIAEMKTNQPEST